MLNVIYNYFVCDCNLLPPGQQIRASADFSSVSWSCNVSRSFVPAIKVWIIQITRQSDVLRSKCILGFLSGRMFLIKNIKSHPSDKLLLLGRNIKFFIAQLLFATTNLSIWYWIAGVLFHFSIKKEEEKGIAEFSTTFSYFWVDTWTII